LTPRIKALAWGLAAAGVVVALDQGTKGAVQSHIGRGEDVEVLPFLTLTNTRNTGVAFGLATDISPVVIGAALVLLLGLLVFLASKAREGAPMWLPAGLLIGGALGNLADRVRQDGVTDFIDLPLWATFNLADVAIVAGVALLIWMPERPQGRSTSERRAKPEAKNAGGRQRSRLMGKTSEL
jgi:signal peptidase II